MAMGRNKPSKITIFGNGLFHVATLTLTVKCQGNNLSLHVGYPFQLSIDSR
jgi:hypothetical protein